MDITGLITLDRIVCDSEMTSKKRVIEVLSELLATEQSDLTARLIFDSLIGRERLGSTGLGHGVALPHGRFNQSEHAIGAFLKLKKAWISMPLTRSRWIWCLGSWCRSITPTNT